MGDQIPGENKEDPYSEFPVQLNGMRRNEVLGTRKVGYQNK
jgi:hypothetical protein